MPIFVNHHRTKEYKKKYNIIKTKHHYHQQHISYNLQFYNHLDFNCVIQCHFPQYNIQRK